MVVRRVLCLVECVGNGRVVYNEGQPSKGMDEEERSNLDWSRRNPSRREGRRRSQDICVSPLTHSLTHPPIQVSMYHAYIWTHTDICRRSHSHTRRGRHPRWMTPANRVEEFSRRRDEHGVGMIHIHIHPPPSPCSCLNRMPLVSAQSASLVPAPIVLPLGLHNGWTGQRGRRNAALAPLKQATGLAHTPRCTCIALTPSRVTRVSDEPPAHE